MQTRLVLRVAAQSLLTRPCHVAHGISLAACVEIPVSPWILEGCLKDAYSTKLG
jgi:hypothetical protein